jgi:hypothetical protein
MHIAKTVFLSVVPMIAAAAFSSAVVIFIPLLFRYRRRVIRLPCLHYTIGYDGNQGLSKIFFRIIFWQIPLAEMTDSS